MSLRRSLPLAVLLLLAGALPVALSEDAKPPVNVKVQMKDYKTGYYLLWVARNYKKEKPPSVILFLPNTMYAPEQYTGVFGNIVEQRGLIHVVVKSPGGPWGAKDEKYLLAVLDDIKKTWPYDEKGVLMVGNTDAADTVLEVGLKHPERFAGLCVMAGMYGSSMKINGPQVKAVPIYIEHGEKSTDQRIPAIRDMVENYKKAGANITFVERKDKVDTIPLDSVKSAVDVLDWFIDAKAGNIKKQFDEAVNAKKNKQTTQAIALFQHVIEVGGKGEYVDQAKKELAEISKAAALALQAAADLEKAEKFADAMKALTELAATYKGLPEAQQAATKLEELKKSPKLKEAADKAEKEKAEQEAGKAFAEAEKKEADKKYAEALFAYEDIVAKYKETSFSPKAQERLDKMKADPEIQKVIATEGARAECEGLMKKAENYRKNGMIDKALETWKQVVDKFPDTEWGKQAADLIQKNKK